MNIVIRQAQDADREFLLTSIIESEKSGSQIISYCAIFSINEATLRMLLNNILDEGMEGQELCTGSFLVAEVDGECAAALSTWVEKESGMASNMIKTNLFMYFMDRAVLMNAEPALALMNEINIARGDHALQIESVYTAEKFRGNGLVKKLIDEHIARRKEEGLVFNKAQIVLLKNNASAIRSYEKAGFAIVAEKKCADPAIFTLLPSDTKILMEKILND